MILLGLGHFDAGDAISQEGFQVVFGPIIQRGLITLGVADILQSFLHVTSALP